MTIEEMYQEAASRIRQKGKFFVAKMIIGNWFLQGFLYKDRSEKIFSIVLEVIIFIFFVILFSQLFELIFSAIIGFVITHTVTWTLNGHFWALMLETELSRFTTGEVRLLNYAKGMSARLQERKCFAAMLAYGSISRGEVHSRSDLDIRLVCEQGISNRIVGCTISTIERIKAFFMHFPLDIHMVDSVEKLKVMRIDEKPLILFMKPEVRWNG